MFFSVGSKVLTASNLALLSMVEVVLAPVWGWIGCNICYAHDSLGVPIRCTQNPTMGEEWRYGWHPERIVKKTTTKKLLVIGAGPSGLEAARVLGERGYDVILAEASRDLGGRVFLSCLNN